MRNSVLGAHGHHGVRNAGEENHTGLQRLEKTNEGLIQRSEAGVDSQTDFDALLQTAIFLRERVHKCTGELLVARRRFEKVERDTLKATEAAQAANRSKSEFLAAAGHDLLQPLNAARLLVSVLAEHPLPQNDLKLVGQVDRALSCVEDLIKSILEVSKLDAGVVVPKMEAVPLRDLLEAVASEFAPAAARKKLRFAVRALDATVRTDPNLLKRAVSNLVSNAVRFTNSGGVLLGARRRAGAVRIDVVDTGIGIPPNQTESVFKDFRRGLNVGNNAAFDSGFGLGLAIVRRMTEALGHTLTFHSIAGHGSIFSLSVPTVDKESAPADIKPHGAFSAYGVGGKRLLLIENDPAMTDAMSTLMDRWHCRMRSAADMRACIALLAEERFIPDLIISDYHLDKGLCGLEIVDALHRWVGRTIPTVIVTADRSLDVEAQIQSRGFIVLWKPLKLAELDALIPFLLV